MTRFLGTCVVLAFVAVMTISEVFDISLLYAYPIAMFALGVIWLRYT